MNGISRPNGDSVIAWGGILVAVAVVMLLVAMFIPTFSNSGFQSSSPYVPDRPPTLNPWKWPLIWLGAAIGNLSVLMLLAGYIVRAISFLPGREAEPVATPAPAVAKRVNESRGEQRADAIAPPEVDDDASKSTLLWVICVFSIFVVGAFAFVFGNRADSPPVAANSAVEQANTLDPVMSGGDQTPRQKEAR